MLKLDFVEGAVAGALDSKKSPRFTLSAALTTGDRIIKHNKTGRTVVFMNIYIHKFSCLPKNLLENQRAVFWFKSTLLPSVG
jgi:hypothetical protein